MNAYFSCPPKADMKKRHLSIQQMVLDLHVQNYYQLLYPEMEMKMELGVHFYTFWQLAFPECAIIMLLGLYDKKHMS